MKKIKAWSFMQDMYKKEKALITDIDGVAEIYTKKPKPRLNPFSDKKWKPVEIEIRVIKHVTSR